MTPMIRVSNSGMRILKRISNKISKVIKRIKFKAKLKK